VGRASEAMIRPLIMSCHPHRRNLRPIANRFAGGHPPAIDSSSGSRITLFFFMFSSLLRRDLQGGGGTKPVHVKTVNNFQGGI
jgi:hypothetical protein